MNHEDKCRRCGKCCQRSIIIYDGRMRQIDGVYCPFFDTKTKLCMCYEQRHEINPICLPVDQAIAKGLLPDDCPYVADVPGYKCKVEGRK